MCLPPHDRRVRVPLGSPVARLFVAGSLPHTVAASARGLAHHGRADVRAVRGYYAPPHRGQDAAQSGTSGEPEGPVFFGADVDFEPVRSTQYMRRKTSW